MDKLEKDLAGKLKLLKFTFNKTSDIVGRANIVTIERHCEALIKITADIEEIKLKILEAKFERQWNIFEAEIDNNSELPAVTKFAYLKELLKPNVRSTVDGLPFSTEGYTRAKIF